MKWLNHILLFIKNDIKLLLRKWKSLPLLLVAPIVLLLLVAFLATAFIGDEEGMNIQVGLTNLDESEETTMIVDMLMETSDLSSMLTIHKMTEDEAVTAIQNNDIAANIIFPESFFKDMMGGSSSTVRVVGNPDMSLESDIVNEIIQTVTRHIRNSQASILAIGYRGYEVGMDSDEQDALIMSQFIEYFIQVMNSSEMLDETLETNIATNNTENYYVLSVWLALLIIWAFIISTFLKSEIHDRLQTRMRLYGVTPLVSNIAKVIVMIICMLILGVVSTLIVYYFTDALNLAFDNVRRIITLIGLFIIAVSGLYMLFSILFVNNKTQIVAKLILTLFLIFFSGALIPTIYFPQYLSPIFDYSISHMAFYWIGEIALNGRFYFEWDKLLYAIGIIYVLIILLSLYEGVRRR